MEDLAALVAANEDAAAAIAAAYEMLLGGVPNIAGFEFLIENAIATNYGSNNPNIVFNQENIFINIANALVQGNPDAAASFAALTAGQASLADKVAAIYNAIVPPSVQTEGGLAYVTRPDALAFYAQVAAERGVAGPDGAAIVALASILNIAYENDLLGVGDSVNDLLAAIKDGSAQLPADGDTFTPIEIADGTNYDGDDFIPGRVTLTENADTVSGTIFDAPRAWTPGGTDQVNTLNDDDVLTGTGEDNILNFVFVNDVDTGDHDINPTLNNINTINVDVRTDYYSPILDLQDSTGVEEVNVSGLDDFVELGIDNIQDATGARGEAGLELSVNNSHADEAGVWFYFDGDAVAGAADRVNLTLNDVDLWYVDIDDANEQAGLGIEDVHLTSKGASNEVDVLFIEDAEKLTIDGDQDLELGGQDTAVRPGTNQVEALLHWGGLGAVAGSLKEVDASALTADLTINLGEETVANQDGTSGTPVDFKIVTGSGNDTIRLLAGLDSKNDTIDGGAGDNTLQVFDSITKGTIANMQLLDIRGNGGEAWNQTIKVDTSLFTGLEEVWIRNESSWNGETATFEPLEVQLDNLSAELAKNISIQHGTTGSNSLGLNYVDLNLKDASGKSDTVAITIADQLDTENRGINIDERFNFFLETEDTENVTINDEDSESNTVDLYYGVEDITGTVTLTGGVAGTFLNLDSFESAQTDPDADADVWAGDLTNLYGVDTDDDVWNGDDGENDAGKDNDNTGSQADYIFQVGADATRIIAATVAAGEYAGDVILRVGGAGPADPNQSITTGAGNDTIVFDATNNTTAGLTVNDVVDGGAGTDDTLAFEGNKQIVLDQSELEGVKNIENIVFIGNEAGTTNANHPQLVNEFGENAYNIRLSDEFMAQNGVEAGAGRQIYIRNDNDLSNETLGKMSGGNSDFSDLDGIGGNTGVTIDASELGSKNSFVYNGEEGFNATDDRFIFSSASANGSSVIDGGAWEYYGPFSSDGDGDINDAGDWFYGNGNNDLYEVTTSGASGSGPANVTIDDLENVSNVGELQFTNRSSTDVTHILALDNETVDRLVNDLHVAGEGGDEEIITVSVWNNPDIPGVDTTLIVDLSDFNFGEGEYIEFIGNGTVVIRGVSDADFMNYIAPQAGNVGGGITLEGDNGVPPDLVSAEIASSSQVILTFNEPVTIDGNVPASSFTVTDSNNAATPATGIVAGPNPNQFTLSFPGGTFTQNDPATITYTDPATGDIIDSIGNPLPNDAVVATEGATFDTAPVLNSVAASADGTTITLDYNEDVAVTGLTGAEFALTDGVQPVTVTGVSVVGGNVVLQLGRALVDGEDFVLTYNDPDGAGGNGIADIDGVANDAANFAGQTVDNAAITNTTVVGTGAADTISVTTADPFGITIQGLGSADTLTGSDFGDTIEGAGGADIINAGLGADRVVGGAGADSIALGIDADVDTVVFTATGEYGDNVTQFGFNDVVSFEGALNIAFDDLAGFNDDVFQFLTSNLNGTATNTALNIDSVEGAVLSWLDNDGPSIVTTPNLGNAATVAALLNDEFTFSNETAGDDLLFIIQGSDQIGSAIYHYEANNANNQIQAAELTLIGIFDNDLFGGNIVFA